MGDIDILGAEGVNSQTPPPFEGFSLLQYGRELTGKGHRLTQMSKDLNLTPTCSST